ncbi:ABC transporter permease [Halovenus sp. WSH3]|uniref:ABC transporter permease n=1 Tax=Halovenus carboxidivorans TaxID=2692199 RepID=A0A6B0TB06_9EURY|nr:ABC transporter permease [Halovenus carboxidivorans]
MAGREITALSREKTIVLALAIQLFIAAFSSFLVVGLTSLYDPSAEGGEIAVGISGDEREKLARVAAETEGVDPTVYESRAAALSEFDNRNLNAVLHTRTVQTDRGTRIAVDVEVPADSLETTLIIVRVRELLLEFERQERRFRAESLEFSPVDMPDEQENTDDFTQYFNFTYTILLPLLLFLPPFISGSVVVDSVTEEIERGTLELLRVAPVSLTEIVDGKAIGMILIAPLQAILWLALLWLNGIAIANAGLLLLLVTAVATLTVAIGLFLGLVTGTRQKAQLLYSTLVLLLFGAAAVLPEHPASTAALLAVDSPTTLTVGHVAGLAVVAVIGFAAVRQYVDGLDPESL